MVLVIRTRVSSMCTWNRNIAWTTVSWATCTCRQCTCSCIQPQTTVFLPLKFPSSVHPSWSAIFNERDPHAKDEVWLCGCFPFSEIATEVRDLILTYWLTIHTIPLRRSSLKTLPLWSSSNCSSCSVLRNLGIESLLNCSAICSNY